MRSLPSFRAARLTVKQIQSHQWPMGPPSPGTNPAMYWSSIAREQWGEFSVSQRLNAWRAGKSLDLLSAEVRRGLLTHNASPVNAVLLVHTPSVKRAASIAYNRIERSVGSVSRRISTRRKPLLLDAPLQPALDRPAQPLKAFNSQNSMVPSIFSVRGASKISRRVHFDEAATNPARLPADMAHAQTQIERRATAPTGSRSIKLSNVELRPSRTLPSGTDVRPARNTKAVRRDDTSLIVIHLDPALLPLVPSARTTLPTMLSPAVATRTAAPAIKQLAIDVPRSKSFKLVTLPPAPRLNLERAAPKGSFRIAPAPKPFNKPKVSRDELVDQVIHRFYVALDVT